MNAVDIEHLSCGYGRGDQIVGLSLSVQAGTRLCVAGVNGAGKSTLLKAIAGLHPPRAGMVRIFGVSAEKPASRRSIAWLPERYVPPAMLTGYEVFRAAVRGESLAWDRHSVIETARALGLGERALSRRVGTYSKGMAQKLGLVSVLARKPRLLILDEPLSGLDPVARAQFEGIMAIFHANGGTVIFTTHLLHDLHRLCDRAIVLHDGRIIADGRPEIFAGGGSAHDAFLDLIHAQDAPTLRVEPSTVHAIETNN